jgi:geranylgeranyl reductase
MVSPRGRQVDIPVGDGFVGMVDRDVFDEFLRTRAAEGGAERREGTFCGIDRRDDGTVNVHYTRGRSRGGERDTVRARMVVGADGALSAVARHTIPAAKRAQHVFAYHEIIESPPATAGGFDHTRCDVYYDGEFSPDFYAWVFPHGKTTSVGTGTFQQGFGMKDAVTRLRASAGLTGRTIRREGAPIPLTPLARWDDGRNVVLAGDAAGVVAPASGEGIFYAMTGGRLAAQAVERALATGRARELATARRSFMRAHGQVFWVLGVMQRFWYSSDNRRERFVAICRDRDVQQLTFDAYMTKKLVRAKPMAHARIFCKNIAHLLGAVSA